MDELLIKYVMEEATADERHHVEVWVAESAENAHRLEEFRLIWSFGRKIVPSLWNDQGEALARFKKRIPSPPSSSASPGNPAPRVRMFSTGKAAAVIAGILVIGGGTWTVLHQKKIPPAVIGPPVVSIPSAGNVTPPRGSAETTMKFITSPPLPVPTGQKDNDTGVLIQKRLPDNTLVLLQKNARVEWLTTASGSIRLARLAGAATFEVVPDPGHPFIVEAAFLRIRVLGTSFTIQSAKDSTTVTVLSGLVQATTDTDSAILRPGEMATAYPGQVPLKVRVRGERPDAKEVMRMLIDETVREKLVSSRENLGWLALDSGRFIIDGRPVSDEVKRRYQSKYLLPDGMGFYYGKVKVHGHGYFFEKKELY